MKTSILTPILVLSSIILLAGDPMRAQAGEVYCEVMSIQGTASVIQNGSAASMKRGDHLKAGDSIKVGDNSYVDIAYDKAWKNVTRVRENSRVRIGSIEPTHLDMKQGDIFSRIKALPKNSSFEIQTPTAIAAVRGTEFRTITEAGGKTEIHNLSELPASQVEVFGLDAFGNKQLTPLILGVEKKTEVPK